MDAQTDMPPDEPRAARISAAMWDRACNGAALILAVLALAVLGLPYLVKGAVDGLAAFLALRQDVPVVPVLLLTLILARRWATAASRLEPPSRPMLWAAAAIGLILMVGWGGHYLVFSGYDLSRDEQMANFDMAIFRSGRLLAAIPVAWRPFAEALNLRFIQPIGDHEYWVSGYLPMHAAWRAALSRVADPALASPLMAALGGFCIWRVSRLLWPQSAATQIISVVLYLGSSQVLVTAMTAFSMSMHLALNMLWLWLFLLNRRRTHAVAMAVGWIATGIHQPLFHPLFVLPFLAMLADQKRWRLLAAYLLAYALIAAFWLAWPLWISAHGSAPAVLNSDTSGVGYVERLRTVIHVAGYNGLWLMAANLLRFVCWQHPLLVPLAIIGVWGNCRQQTLSRALAIGFVMPIAFMAAVLPWQGHGWGYRYVHPVLGNAVLLGTYGWHSLESAGISLRRAMLITSALALLVLFPLHAVMAHRIVAPFAELRSQLVSADADMLVVDAETAPYAGDLVVNDPDLADRPKLLLAPFLGAGQLGSLCRLGSIAFVRAPRLAPLSQLFDIRPPTGDSTTMARLVAAAPGARCSVRRF